MLLFRSRPRALCVSAVLVFRSCPRALCMSVCISSISVLLNSFFGPSCFPLSNIMSQSSCCSLVYLRAAQQSCSSKLCFISGGQGGPTAKTASQALPVGLKLHALLCCVYKDIPILIDPFFYVHFVRTLYLDHFFGFYLSVKASKNAGFFSYRPLCVFTCFCIYQSICGDVLSAQEPVTDTHASLWQRAKGRILRA